MNRFVPALALLTLAALAATELQARTAEFAATARKNDARINTLTELSAALQACWQPSAEQSVAGAQITVRLSFKRDGDLVGPPRLTFRTPGLTGDQQNAYFKAVVDSLRRCVPAPVSAAFGAAIAGRPLTVRFIDTRNSTKAEQKA